MAAPSAQVCMSDFTAALLRRDIDAALGLLSDDALLFYSNGAVLRKTDFASVMTSAWKVVEDYRYSTAHLRWIVETDAAAAAVYGFEWTGVARGQQVGGSGRATRLFEKGPDGWLLAHEHLSTGQGPT
jgi:ketosteroid isomerase-like protein